MRRPVFLKLGGSLITDKDKPNTVNAAALARLADEIAQARMKDPSLPLVIGHGSGSFGHVPAAKHGTRRGVRDPQGWRGFSEVWQAARALNQLVVEAFIQAGLQIIAYPPSAWMVTAELFWQPAQQPAIAAAIDAGMIPLVNGDAVFDHVLGGTIVSTEEVFNALAPLFNPCRVLVAGMEPGVWADIAARSHLLTELHLSRLSDVTKRLQGSASVDVTGGMNRKVRDLAAIVSLIPDCEARIFGAQEPSNLLRVLTGEPLGTRIYP